MASTLLTLSLIFFILAGIFAGTAVIFWFIFKIPIIIGDFNGRNAKKSIEQMRIASMNSEKSKKKKEKIDYLKTKSHMEQLEAQLSEEKTELLQQQKEDTILLDNDEETIVQDADKTILLAKNIQQSQGITVIDNIMIIHTQETIEI